MSGYEVRDRRGIVERIFVCEECITGASTCECIHAALEAMRETGKGASTWRRGVMLSAVPTSREGRHAVLGAARAAAEVAA